MLQGFETLEHFFIRSMALHTTENWEGLVYDV